METLGPNWTIIGSGLRAKLLHTPVRWFFDTVGIDPIPNREKLTITHLPLIEPLDPGTLTEWQDHYDSRHCGHDYHGRQIDIFDTVSAAELVIWWAEGPASELFDARSEAALTPLREKQYLERNQSGPARWTILAGLRVITDTGSPLEVIDNAIEYFRGWVADPKAPLVMFWTQFREVAAADDRERTLRWLDEHRRAAVREHYPLPDSVFADVLEDLGDG
ncbi:hypothetical protein ACQGAO_28710 [Rhodococcus sp. 1.20]